MFLVAITHRPIAPRLAPFRPEEIVLPGAIATIVTDGVVARSEVTEGVLSVVESPAGSRGKRAAEGAAFVCHRGGDGIELFRPMRGGRPLLHHITAQGDLLVSTHVSMLRAAGVVLEENRAALPEFFAYRYVMGPMTLYKGVEQVPPGGRVHVQPTNGRHEVRRVESWAPAVAREYGGRDDPALWAETREALARAVGELDPCRDEVVALLSGGLDSSILTRLCQARHGSDRTYSAGFPFEDPDRNVERDYALSAASAFRTKHAYFEPPTAEYLHDFIAAVQAAEEPVHHLQSVLLFALFSRGMASRDRVVVCGEGADGVFGNGLHNTLFAEDRRYLHLRSRRRLHRALSNPASSAVLRATSMMTGRGRLFADYLDRSSPVNRPLSDAGHVVWTFGRYGDINWIRAFLGVTEADIIERRFRALAPLKDRSMYDIVGAYAALGEGSATQSIWSKLAEAGGKILDYPFYGPEVLRCAAAVPWNVRLKEPKYVLRGIARGLGVAEFIVSRPKSSFGVAPARWATRHGAFEPLVPLAARVIDEAEIRAVQKSDHDTAMTFWSILNYAVWRRLWIHGEPVERLHSELDEAITRANA